MRSRVTLITDAATTSGAIQTTDGARITVTYDEPTRRFTLTDPETHAPVGYAKLSQNRQHVIAVGIARAYQRRGLATALYDYIEATLGVTLTPSPVRTPDGKAFWAARSQKTAKPRP